MVVQELEIQTNGSTIVSRRRQDVVETHTSMPKAFLLRASAGEPLAGGGQLRASRGLASDVLASAGVARLAVFACRANPAPGREASQHLAETRGRGSIH